MASVFPTRSSETGEALLNISNRQEDLGLCLPTLCGHWLPTTEGRGAWWLRKPPWMENKFHSGMQLWALCSQASQQLRDGSLQSGRWTITSATIYHLWCLHPSVSQSVHLFWEQLLRNFDWFLIQEKLKRGKSVQWVIACVTVAGLQFGSGFHFLLLVHPIPDSPMLD